MQTVIVHDPEKKTKFFVSKISTTRAFSSTLSGSWGASKKRDVIRIRIAETKIVHVGDMSGGGSLMKIFVVDDEVRQKFMEIDAIVKEQTQINNNKWFNNLLDDDTITSMFRPAINSNTNILTVLLSDYSEPNIYKDGTLVESHADINAMLHKQKQQGMSVMVDIEAQGVYFYPKKFGIRWVVKNIHMVSECQESDISQDDLADKDTIEETWSNDIDIFHMSVDKDIVKLKERIEQLNQLKTMVSVELDSARRIPDICSEWDDRLKKISNTIMEYYSGHNHV